MRLLLLCLLFSLLLSLAPGIVSGDVTRSAIRLTVSPQMIYADGKSVCAVSAEVRDSSGAPAADGVQVRFSTSLGVIDTSANTNGGVARAILRSGTQPGQAMVSAVLTDGQAVAQALVDFLAPGAQIEPDAIIDVSSERYLAFAADSQTIDASGKCRLEHRGLVIEAENVQIDLDRNVARARGQAGGSKVRVARGAKTITASALTYDLSAQRGLALVEDDAGKITRQYFSGVDLSSVPISGQPAPKAFDFVDLSNTRMLVKAESITVRPRREVQFKGAEVYLNGERVLKLPLYLIPLAGDPTRGPQYLGFSSAGVRVNIPIYFSLSPTGVGSVRIRNQQGGWSRYSSLPGWAVDLEQSYAGARSEGRVTVGEVNRGDWGLDWEHNQQVGRNSRLVSYVGFPARRDLFGTMSFSGPLGEAGSLTLNLRGTRYKGRDGTMASDLYLRTNPRRLSQKLKYSMGLRASFSNEKRIVVDGVDPGGLPVLRTERYGYGSGLQLQLYSLPLSFGRKTSLSTSLSLGQDWGRLRSGFSAYGNAMLTSSFGARSSIALGYTYTREPGLLENYGHHRASLSYMFYGGKWSGALSSVYTLDQRMTSAYASMAYQFTPLWRLDLRGTYQVFGAYGLSDLEIGLGRRIGSQDVSVVWSKSLRKLRLELGSISF